MLRAFEWDQDGYVDDLWEPSDNHLQDVSLGSSPGPRESVTVIAAVEDTVSVVCCCLFLVESSSAVVLSHSR